MANVLLESNPWGNPWYDQPRRHSRAARRGWRGRTRNPVTALGRSFGLQNAAQGVGGEEVLGAVGGFAASSLIPPMIVRDAGTQGGKLMRIAAGVVATVLVGMAARSVSPKAARAAIVGGFAGTAIQAIQAFTPLKVMGSLGSGRMGAAEIVNFPRDEQSETVSVIQP